MGSVRLSCKTHELAPLRMSHRPAVSVRGFEDLAPGFVDWCQDAWTRYTKPGTFGYQRVDFQRPSGCDCIPAGLRVSSGNLAHPWSVQETWNTPRDRNWLNFVGPTAVASLQNLDNRHLLSVFRVSDIAFRIWISAPTWDTGSR